MISNSLSKLWIIYGSLLHYAVILASRISFNVLGIVAHLFSNEVRCRLNVSFFEAALPQSVAHHGTEVTIHTLRRANARVFSLHAYVDDFSQTIYRRDLS